jgi:cell division protein ZapA
MAEVRIMVGGRQYAVHCRDGEEARLHHLAGLITQRMARVSQGNSGLTEVRQLLFANLLLADELDDTLTRKPPPPAAPAPAEDDPAVVAAIERLTTRLEGLAETLAGNGRPS